MITTIIGILIILLLVIIAYELKHVLIWLRNINNYHAVTIKKLEQIIAELIRKH